MFDAGEKEFLDDLTKGLTPSSRLGSHKDRMEFWYNRQGDCIEFQTVDEAVIADRIDDHLTLYRSVEKREPIGFQIKGIKALISISGGEGIEVRTSKDGNQIVSVRILLLRAYDSDRSTITRITGYADAMRPLAKAPEDDRVTVQVG